MHNVYFVSSEDSGESNALISIEFKLYSAAVPAELKMVVARGAGHHAQSHCMKSCCNQLSSSSFGNSAATYYINIIFKEIPHSCTSKIN